MSSERRISLGRRRLLHIAAPDQDASLRKLILLHLLLRNELLLCLWC